MNIIADKLNLPCDMKREVCKYYYDECGYTIADINKIKHVKGNRRNKFMKLRQKMELAHWYKFNVSVSWLTHDGRGNGWYGKKSHRNVFGGGTLAETQHLRYYNGITSYCKKINDPENKYIEKMIEQGDTRRVI